MTIQGDPATDPSAPTSGTGAASQPESDLYAALARLRAALADVTYPLRLPSADEARPTSEALLRQLDDYLLPRLSRLDAPLLVVVGGSTGAGKSTLVNSLVRTRVTTAGALRPTTRAPLLVCHPRDLPWFRQRHLLPGLIRVTAPTDDPRMLQLVSAPALPPGVAFLDAPDIDSVIQANRALAAQLLAAADLWLFVTTAARYADAVPWGLLRTARLRGTVIALVLNRVPWPARDEVAGHLTEMLATNNLATVPLFVIPETEIDGQGLLPEAAAAPLRDWFGQIAADPQIRAGVIRQTLDGAVAALTPAVSGLAAAVDEQIAATIELEERVSIAYGNARQTIRHALRDGRLLRGEVLARWQEFLGSGELFRSLETHVGRIRDRVTARLSNGPSAGQQLQTAIESQLVTLLRDAVADAAEAAYRSWQAHPAGAALLAPALARPGPALPERIEQVLQDWRRAVLELVRAEAQNKRRIGRGAAYAVNTGGLAVMVAVFTSTAFIPTGLEVAVGAGTAIVNQKVLEAIFGDQAIRTLASKARTDLLNRLDVLLTDEAGRYRNRLHEAGAETDRIARSHSTQLRAAATAVERAREAAALAGPAQPPSSGAAE